MRNSVLVSVALIVVAGCGGEGGSSTPTTPTQPPPTNRPPTITAATVNPTSGIATLTTHTFTVAASDPDGDAITYTWDFGNGEGSPNSSGTTTYTNRNTTTYQATVTVRDTRGATASASVSVTSATITGTFAGNLEGFPITVSLEQFLGGVVTGTWQMPTFGAHGEVGPAGEPGRIQADGQFELRFKVRVGSFADFYYRGSMDPTGQRLTGTLQGSGFTGEFMQLDKS